MQQDARRDGGTNAAAGAGPLKWVGQQWRMDGYCGRAGETAAARSASEPTPAAQPQCGGQPDDAHLPLFLRRGGARPVRIPPKRRGDDQTTAPAARASVEG